MTDFALKPLLLPKKIEEGVLQFLRRIMDKINFFLYKNGTSFAIYKLMFPYFLSKFVTHQEKFFFPDI